MTVFILKIIAMISMILDHVKYAIPTTRCFPTEYFGRLALPIFAFLISEGFIHTHNRTKYMMRILFFAIISQIPFYMYAKHLVHNDVNLNVLFTFEIALLGLSIIDFFKRYEGMEKWIKYSVVVASLSLILVFTYYIHPDYSWYGVTCVWLFYLFRNNKFLISISFIMLNIVYYYIKVKKIGLVFSNKTYLSMIFSIFPLAFILLYNGKQGKKFKYFFYVFYPLHFIILYGINYFFFK